MKNPEKISLQIRKKLQKIVTKQNYLDEQHKLLQELCPHIYLRYKCEGSTGNWDREDSFWVRWRCPDCDKFWTTSQGEDFKQMLKTYPHAFKVDAYDDRIRYGSFDKDSLFSPYKINTP